MFDIVTSRQTIRKRVADRIRYYKREGMTIDRHTVEWVKQHCCCDFPRPTAHNLWIEALQSLRYSQTPVRRMGNEYYDMCGAEDGAYERRDFARREAKMLYEAAKRLNPFVITIPELEK